MEHTVQPGARFRRATTVSRMCSVIVPVAIFAGCGGRSPAAQAACPAGTMVTVQLGTVYAAPREPDGSAWAGPPAGFKELICSEGARRVRELVVSYANQQAPGIGSVADRVVGPQFERAVSDACGTAFDWVRMSFWGPAMYAYGWNEGQASPLWQTTRPSDSDFRSTLSTTTSGGAASWTADCASDSVAVAQVWNWHLLTRDEQMGSIRIPIADIPAAALCGGWAWVPGRDGEGLIGATVRVSVAGRGSCDGVTAGSLDDFTVR